MLRLPQFYFKIQNSINILKNWSRTTHKNQDAKHFSGVSNRFCELSLTLELTSVILTPYSKKVVQGFDPPLYSTVYVIQYTDTEALLSINRLCVYS